MSKRVSLKALNERTERLMPKGIPRYIACYDNGGRSADRYTVVYTRIGGGQYIGMNDRPFHPQSIGMHGEGCVRGAHLGKRIKFTALPRDCQRMVLYDYREIWSIP